MIGAIAGDIIGSIHEGADSKPKQFELFGPSHRFTDDTLLTVAIAESVPTVGVMRQILDAIDLSLVAGRPVYVHCFGGVGRTGTAVCCWMIRHGLATPDNVLQALLQLRQADQQTKGRKAPESSEQIRFVQEWSG